MARVVVVIIVAIRDGDSQQQRCPGRQPMLVHYDTEGSRKLERTCNTIAYARARVHCAAASELELANHDGPSSTFDVARDRIESGEERVGKIPAACWS